MDDFEQITVIILMLFFDLFLLYVKMNPQQKKLTRKLFFKALKKIDSFRGDCKINVWLCQIAKNTYYTLAKKQTRYADYSLGQIPFDESIEEKKIKKRTSSSNL